MRRILIPGILFLLTSGALASSAGDDDAATREEDGRSFRRAVGQHYRVDDDAVARARKHGIPDDELPVVFHIAGAAHVEPEAVIEMRRKGRKSWMDVSAHFGLTAESFYAPTKKIHGPPYGKAYGYYRNKKRGEWASIQLDDSAIVHLTHVKFLSKHYGLTPDEVIEQQGKGAGLVGLHASVKKRHDGKGSGGPHADGKKGARGGPARDDHPADRGARGHGKGDKDANGSNGSKGRGKKKGAGV